VRILSVSARTARRLALSPSIDDRSALIGCSFALAMLNHRRTALSPGQRRVTLVVT
jgi:hypothetical protein